MDETIIVRELKINNGDYSMAITSDVFYSIVIKHASSSQRGEFCYKVDMTKEIFLSLAIPILNELGYTVFDKKLLPPQKEPT